MKREYFSQIFFLLKSLSGFYSSNEFERNRFRFLVDRVFSSNFFRVNIDFVFDLQKSKKRKETFFVSSMFTFVLFSLNLSIHFVLSNIFLH